MVLSRARLCISVVWVIYLSSDGWHELLIRVGLNILVCSRQAQGMQILELVVPGLVAVVQVLDLLLQQTTTNCDALPCKHICYKSIKLCLGPDSDSLLKSVKSAYSVSRACVRLIQTDWYLTRQRMLTMI